MNSVFEFFEPIKDAHIILQFLGVFVVGAIPFLEAYIAAPLGVAIGLPLVMTIVAAALGNWLSVMAVILASDWMQQRFQKGRKANSGGSAKRMKRAQELFGKYGVPGVALIGPLLIGNHIGAFISIVSGADKRYVTLWQTISIVLWAAGSGLLVYLGVDLIAR